MKITNPRTKAALHIAGAVAAVAALCALVILIGRGCQKDNDTPSGPQHSVADSVNTDGEDSQKSDHSGSQVPNNSGTSNPGTSDKPPLEDYEDFGDNTEDDVPVGTYKNDKVLSFNYGSGTLYLGVETDTSDAIYLNPSSSEAAARPDKQIGFYIMSSSPELSYSEWEGAEPTDKLNSNRANLVFKGDKFNTAVPAAFHNTVDYGVKWSRSELQLNDDDGGTVLYIRIVQISTGKLLAVCKATITYDPATNSHSLTSLTDNNITATGELDGTGESADDLAAQAVEYLKTKGGIATTDENWKKAAKSCIIEKVPTTYAFRFIGTDGNETNIGNYENCDIYAVNIQFPGDFNTVYFAPKMQIMGFERPTEPGKTEIRLQVLGMAEANHRDYGAVR